jgi:hypothetical protein
VTRKGNGVPALFSDEATISALTSHGFPLGEAETTVLSDAWNRPCRERVSFPPTRDFSICRCVWNWR